MCLWCQFLPFLGYLHASDNLYLQPKREKKHINGKEISTNEKNIWNSKLVQKACHSSTLLTFSSLRSVLTLGDYMDKSMKFSWQHFFRCVLPLPSFWRLRERDTQLVSVFEAGLELSYPGSTLNQFSLNILYPCKENCSTEKGTVMQSFKNMLCSNTPWALRDNVYFVPMPKRKQNCHVTFIHITPSPLRATRTAKWSLRRHGVPQQSELCCLRASMRWNVLTS